MIYVNEFIENAQPINKHKKQQQPLFDANNRRRDAAKEITVVRRLAKWENVSVTIATR